MTAPELSTCEGCARVSECLHQVRYSRQAATMIDARQAATPPHIHNHRYGATELRRYNARELRRYNARELRRYNARELRRYNARELRTALGSYGARELRR